MSPPPRAPSLQINSKVSQVNWQLSCSLWESTLGWNTVSGTSWRAYLMQASVPGRRWRDAERLSSETLFLLNLLFSLYILFQSPILACITFLISVYQHREGSTWVILVNLIFGLLTMFHLAYLGVMFDQSSPEQVAIRVRKMERVTNISLR